jgi:SAM-dependent methyltransferase
VKVPGSSTEADQLLAEVRTAGWRVPDSFLQPASAYDRDFLRVEMTGRRTRDYYARRLDMLAFDQGGCVLDAACGVGQWSVVLADRFARVIGIDLNEDRLALARALARSEDRAGCEFLPGRLERLPVAGAGCDAVFCYGAFMFTDMPRTLAEFRRVLRPGGRLYLNANSFGWCAHLLFDRGWRGGQPEHARAALRMLGRMLLGRTQQIVVRRGWLRRQLEAAGFLLRGIGAEGTVNLSGRAAAATPAYPERYYGLPAILEVVAERSG